MTNDRLKTDVCKKCGGPKAYDSDHHCKKCFDKMVSNVKDASTIEVAIVDGAEGPSIIFNDCIIAGTKPYGGGAIIRKWIVSLDDLQRALENKFYIIPKNDRPEQWVNTTWDMHENLRITWSDK